MIIYTNLFGFLKYSSYVGITIFPFIFIGKQYKNRPNLINHEKIHFQQQIELLVLPFFVLYFLNYLINLFKYRFNHNKAYYNIIFEKEAYNNETNLDYLKVRIRYNWISNVF